MTHTRVSQLLAAKRLEFRAAGQSEFMKQIDRPAMDHLPQFEEGFVRRQICIDDLLIDFFGTFEDPRRGQDAHSAQICVKPNQAGNVRFVVLERVNIAFGGLFNEFFVEVLSADEVVGAPLGTYLRPLSQPGRR